MNVSTKALHALSMLALTLATVWASPAPAQVAPAQQSVRTALPRAIAPSRGSARAATPDRVLRGTLGPLKEEVWRLPMNKGDEFQIDLSSEVFDTFLELYREGATDATDRNDNNGFGDSKNSRLRFQAPFAGTYYVVARNRDDDRTGEYELIIRRREASSDVCTASLGVITSAQVEELKGSDAYARSCYFQGRKGQRVRIGVNASGFQPEISLIQGQMFLGSDDKGVEGSDALLIRTLPLDGPYEIRVGAAALESKKARSFTLMVRDTQPPASTVQVRELALGTVVSGSFAETTPVTSDQPYEVYRVTGRKDEAYDLSVRWNGAPAAGQIMRVETGDDTPLGFGTVQYRTMSSSTRPVNLRIRFEADGYALIRLVMPVLRIGEYSIRIDPATASPASAN